VGLRGPTALGYGSGVPRFLVRAPDHLGDGVLALPAIGALAAAGPCRVVGPKWARELYGHLPQDPVEEPEIAVLFKPAFRAAWEARRVPRRVGLRWDLRGPLLTDAVEALPGHRLDTYAAIAAAAGVVATGGPSLPSRPDSAPPLPPRAVLLLPLSASGAVVEWGGFRALADRLSAAGLSPVFAAGPGQDAALGQVAGPHLRLPALPLAGMAAAAVRAVGVVGNDSGLTHLAAAARRAAGASVLAVQVVCGSTSPARTAAPGATAHTAGPGLDCWPCYRKTCGIGVPCLQVPVSDVLAAVVGRAG
jgi:ADP-heptose:LPS heptosyltransferase